MYGYSTYLKVCGDQLYGRRHFWSRWQPIIPSDIKKVREYGVFGSYIKIWTSRGTFFVGIFTKQYFPVTEFLRKKTTFDLTTDEVHNFNVAICKGNIWDLFRKKP